MVDRFVMLSPGMRTVMKSAGSLATLTSGVITVAHIASAMAETRPAVAIAALDALSLDAETLARSLSDASPSIPSPRDDTSAPGAIEEAPELGADAKALVSRLVQAATRRASEVIDSGDLLVVLADQPGVGADREQIASAVENVRREVTEDREEPEEL